MSNLSLEVTLRGGDKKGDFSEAIQGIYATLEEALAKGEALLLEYYPEVYEEAMTWDKEAQS